MYTSCQLYDKVLWSRPSHWFSPGQPLSRECWFHQLLQMQCILSMYANYHPKSKCKSCQPIFGMHLLKLLFGSQVVGFFRGRYRELLECNKVPFQTSCVVFVRPVVVRWNRLKITWKKNRTLSRIMRGNRFLAAPGIGVELIRRIRRRVVVRTVQRRLVPAGYRSKHSDRWSRLTLPDHRRHCRMNWNHQHWSHVIFVDESKVSLYHYDRHVSWMHQSTSLSTTRR